MKRLLVLNLLICICLNLQAQTYQFEMVSNINPSTGSNPRWFTVMDTTMYFFANEPINGFKMYSIQNGGQPSLCPNLGGGVYGDGSISTSKRMGVLNSKLYYPASIPPNGRELYTYDGINAPSLVMDINPGTASGAPFYMMTFNNKVYFQANNGVLGSELWSHEPLTNTTTCLTDINPGSPSSTIAFITAFNGKLYFAGSNGNDTIIGNTGVELYSYDPVVNSTSLVMDIYPGYMPSNPFGLTVINNKLYFVASDPLYGKELYMYDGNTVTRLTDMNPGPAQGVYTSDHSYPTHFNGCIYFAANDASNFINLGKYDLSTNTASIIYCSGANYGGNPRYFKVFDNRLFFTNLDSINGYELWSYDGINAPAITANIRPGSTSSLPVFMEVFNDELYFNAMNDTSSGEELFRLKRKESEEPASVPSINYNVYCSLFPQPANHSVQVNISMNHSSSDLFVDLISLSGQKLFAQALKNLGSGNYQCTIDMDKFVCGMYILQFRNESGIYLHRQKLVK